MCLNVKNQLTFKGFSEQRQTVFDASNWITKNNFLFF